jgi:hypothetical protein
MSGSVPSVVSRPPREKGTLIGDEAESTVEMSVLVTTDDGYHIFTSSGKHLTSLEGHRLESLTPGPDGTFLAIVDRHELWSHGRDGEWTPLAKTDRELSAVVAVGDDMFVGTADAGVMRRGPSGSLTPIETFDAVAGRAAWHAVGGPLQVRSMTATADGGALLVNVHVGGIPRSVDGGTTWHPTIDVDADVHQVLAHPTRPEIVVAAASVGLCRSRDGGATWDFESDGMELAYARAVAIIGDEVLISGSEGPRSRRAAIYRAPVDGGAIEPVIGGLPHHLGGNVDTGCLATDGAQVALVDGDGDLWQSAAGLAGFARVTPGLRHVTGVAVA